MSNAPRDLLDADCAYDGLAPAHDLLSAGYADAPWLAAIARLARAHGLAGRRALDVACGTGKSLEALLEPAFEALGSDASPGMGAVARDKARGAGGRPLFLVRRARRERRPHALAAVDG